MLSLLWRIFYASPILISKRPEPEVGRKSRWFVLCFTHGAMMCDISTETSWAYKFTGFLPSIAAIFQLDIVKCSPSTY